MFYIRHKKKIAGLLSVIAISAFVLNNKPLINNIALNIVGEEKYRKLCMIAGNIPYVDDALLDGTEEYVSSTEVANSTASVQNSIKEALSEYLNFDFESSSNSETQPEDTETHNTSNTDCLPEYSGEAYVTINDNIPGFTEDEITNISYESYSELDSLGRCGTAEACVGQDIMPTEKRGEIGQIKPSGWHTVKYPEYISDRYLYNRCHLIGYQLTGENANVKNLITGTRYLNVTGMLPFENEIAGYVKETNNHVMYRVTPCFADNELVARGVYMEAYSVEDSGKGVSFNVYCFNIQPNITIDYATGDSWVSK